MPIGWSIRADGSTCCRIPRASDRCHMMHLIGRRTMGVYVSQRYGYPACSAEGKMPGMMWWFDATLCLATLASGFLAWT